MPKSFFLLCGVTIVVTGAFVARSQSQAARTCAAAEAKRAVREVGHVQGWEALYASFKRFGRCDAGKVAEEYSYAISRLLAHDWEHVGALIQLAADDREFKQFVLRHIDENIPDEEAQLIIRNSSLHCPTDGKWLCDAIADY